MLSEHDIELLERLKKNIKGDLEFYTEIIDNIISKNEIEKANEQVPELQLFISYGYHGASCLSVRMVESKDAAIGDNRFDLYNDYDELMFERLTLFGVAKVISDLEGGDYA